MEISRMRYPEKAAKKARGTGHINKSVVLMMLFLLVSSLSGYTILAIIKPAPVVRANQLPIENGPAVKDIPLDWPAVGQASIGSVEQGTLADTANQAPIPIASTAKMITALAVLESKPIKAGSQGETIIMKAADIDLYNHYLAINGSNVVVTIGESLTEYQALEALLLPSANNMADSLAIWAFGSIDAYTTYAKSMLLRMGAKQSVVSDASGFSPLTTSTAHDLVLIGQKALQNPILKQIVAEKQAEIPVAGIIHNVNELLGNEDIIGIKTGNTEEAGGCILFAAIHIIDGSHSVTIIGVIAGAPSLIAAFQDTLTLLHSAAEQFKAITILPAHTKIYTYVSPWGQSVDAYSTSALTTYGWAGKQYHASFVLKDIYAPLKSGSEVGSAYLKVDGQDITTRVILSTSLVSPSRIWRLKHYF